jgi:hypothetical protein
MTPDTCQDSKIDVSSETRAFNAAIADFDDRTEYQFDRVDDINAIRVLATLRGWRWIADAITHYELAQIGAACAARWDQIKPL